MSKKGTFLILLLAMFSLQCRNNEGTLPIRKGPGNDHEESSPADDKVDLSDASSKLVGIETEEVALRHCNHVLRRTGRILAPRPQTAIISHAFSARIAEVHVKIGDVVEKGQPLVTLECQEIGQAESEFYKALADLELAKATLDRETELLESGIGVKKNHAAAETAYKIAESAAEAAEKSLHVLGFDEQQVKQIADTHQINPAITLNSPIAGKVVTNNAVRGALVDQLTEILKIVDLSVLWVDAEIFEKDIAKVKIGQKVGITVPAYPNEVFQGEVTYIADIVDEKTRTITVRAEVGNQQRRLKLGLFADVEISLNGNKKVLAIPMAAILEEGDLKIVFVQQQEGTYERRKVETGFCDGKYRHVTGGLETGELVVVEGNHQLRSELKKDQLHHGHPH